jgi:hypothetical protein
MAVEIYTWNDGYGYRTVALFNNIWSSHYLCTQQISGTGTPHSIFQTTTTYNSIIYPTIGIVDINGNRWKCVNPTITWTQYGTGTYASLAAHEINPGNGNHPYLVLVRSDGARFILNV